MNVVPFPVPVRSSLFLAVDVHHLPGDRARVTLRRRGLGPVLVGEYARAAAVEVAFDQADHRGLSVCSFREGDAA